MKSLISVKKCSCLIPVKWLKDVLGSGDNNEKVL